MNWLKGKLIHIEIIEIFTILRKAFDRLNDIIRLMLMNPFSNQ